MISNSITLLAPWADKMNQILPCAWLHEWARWSYLRRSGLSVEFRKKDFSESHTTEHILYWPRLLRQDGRVLASFFCEFNTQKKKRTWPLSSHLDLTLGQQPIPTLVQCSYDLCDVMTGEGKGVTSKADFRVPSSVRAVFSRSIHPPSPPLSPRSVK